MTSTGHKVVTRLAPSVWLSPEYDVDATLTIFTEINKERTEGKYARPILTFQSSFHPKFSHPESADEFAQTKTDLNDLYQTYATFLRELDLPKFPTKDIITRSDEDVQPEVSTWINNYKKQVSTAITKGDKTLETKYPVIFSFEAPNPYVASSLVSIDEGTNQQATEEEPQIGSAVKYA